MSDLQCAATLLVCPVDAGALLREAGPELVAERVAAVYTSHAAPAVEVGAEAARLLKVPAFALNALDGGGGTEGFRTALAGLADAHRGETVLVACDRVVRDRHLPAACGLPPGTPVPQGMARVRVDADAWVLDAWPWGTSRAPEG